MKPERVNLFTHIQFHCVKKIETKSQFRIMKNESDPQEWCSLEIRQPIQQSVSITLKILAIRPRTPE